MITRAQKIRLGIFFTVSISLLMVTLVILTGVEMGGNRDIYMVRYTVSMSGLEPGAPVKYNGVRVGRVENIKINKEDVSEVIVILSLDKGTPIKKDTKAVVAVTGITGLKYVELTGGTRDSEFLEPGSEIQGEESILDRLSDHAENIAQRTEVVLEQIRKATTPENQERLFRIADEFAKLIVSVNQIIDENREDIKYTVTSAKNSVGHIEDLLGNAKHEITLSLSALRRFSEKLNEGIEKERVKKIISDIEQITDKIRKAVDTADMPKLVSGFARTVEGLELTILKSKEKISASLNYLQEGLENLAEFSRIIRENPSVLLGGKTEQGRVQ